MNRLLGNFPTALLLSGWLLICLAGCGGGPVRPPVHPVTGQAFFQKMTPAAGAFIVFHPVSEALEKAMEARPFARVQPDGSFSLTTYDEGDGAPEGEYGVTVVWTAAKSTGPRIRDGRLRLRINLPDATATQKKPALTAKVAHGQNTFRFDLE